MQYAKMPSAGAAAPRGGERVLAALDQQRGAKAVVAVVEPHQVHDLVGVRRGDLVRAERAGEDSAGPRLAGVHFARALLPAPARDVLELDLVEARRRRD